MSQYIFAFLAALLTVLVCWYCHRWGRSDGRSEGYAEGYAAGLFEGAADDESNASPSGVGGPGPVPR